MKPVYKRLLLKLSGEVLAGEKGTGIDFEKVLDVCERVKQCVDMGVQVAIVVGGGTSGGEDPPARWTEPVPTTWVCLQHPLTLWLWPTLWSS